VKKIVKVLGLPRTGTNLVQLLLNLNFKNYVCEECEHYQHYLGWKHGLPLPKETYETLERMTQEEIFFVLTTREYDSWQRAVAHKHIGKSWEFPERFHFHGNNPFVFVTPNQYEFYKDLREFYEVRTKAYSDFAEANPDRCYVVKFENLKTPEGQKEEVLKLGKKFGLTFSQKEELIHISKQLDWDGRFVA